MKISGFIWLDQYVNKLEDKHGVYPEEVEEVFATRPLIHKMKRGKIRHEDVYRALGRTYDERYLVVYFIYKKTNEALISTLYDLEH